MMESYTRRGLWAEHYDLSEQDHDREVEEYAESEVPELDLTDSASVSAVLAVSDTEDTRIDSVTGDVEIRWLVDTGADVHVVSRDTYEKLGKPQLGKPI